MEFLVVVLVYLILWNLLHFIYFSVQDVQCALKMMMMMMINIAINSINVCIVNICFTINL